MTNSYNFTLKIETNWAKKFLKTILETWNVIDLIVLSMVYLFPDKKCKKMQYKKILKISNKKLK